MEIIFNSENLDITEALQRHAHSKLGNVERRFGDRLTRIEVYLKDINSSKGGVDKHCVIEARPAGFDPMVGEATTDDAYTSVQAAAKRLERVLEHALDRNRRR